LPDDGDLATAHQLNNKILSALTGQIPILGFEVEGGRLQDVFLHLTEWIKRELQLHKKFLSTRSRSRKKPLPPGGLFSGENWLIYGSAVELSTSC
jgi:hypothetical protein